MFNLRTYINFVKHFSIGPNRSFTISTFNKMSSDKLTSIHTAQIDEIHDVPLIVIRRPIPPVLDEVKVKSLMETYKVIQYEKLHS